MPRHPGSHADFLRADYRTPRLLRFVSALLGSEDAVLRRIRLDTPRRGLPPINIGPEEGRLLHFLARACSARRAVEVGTLAGYSACWIARALGPRGMLHSVEFDPGHARVARENIRTAGLAGRVKVHQGAALEVLPGLERRGPFDFCFIDADKANYPAYLRWAARNLRPGGIVAGDNAYLFGKLHLPPGRAGADASGVPAMRGFLRGLAAPRDFSSCAMIPTGEGLAVAVRR